MEKPNLQTPGLIYIENVNDKTTKLWEGPTGLLYTLFSRDDISAMFGVDCCDNWKRIWVAPSEPKRIAAAVLADDFRRASMAAVFWIARPHFPRFYLIATLWSYDAHSHRSSKANANAPTPFFDLYLFLFSICFLLYMCINAGVYRFDLPIKFHVGRYWKNQCVLFSYFWKLF